ncbi:endonuclease related [Anaeramoeba flamelloides]|uniref:Endonuclease related n=1 Tax=Anaeramoeba flamelloides TaxID=1746091 RepID=A0ABQ8YS26_9EUKA|nr:endonuclease related [Anaeramoeba flamelloides]
MNFQIENLYIILCLFLFSQSFTLCATINYEVGKKYTYSVSSSVNQKAISDQILRPEKNNFTIDSLWFMLTPLSHDDTKGYELQFDIVEPAYGEGNCLKVDSQSAPQNVTDYLFEKDKWFHFWQYPSGKIHLVEYEAGSNVSAVNFKKSIISQLHITDRESNLYAVNETDVCGTYLAKYKREVDPEMGSVVFTRTKHSVVHFDIEESFPELNYTSTCNSLVDQVITRRVCSESSHFEGDKSFKPNKTSELEIQFFTNGTVVLQLVSVGENEILRQQSESGRPFKRGNSISSSLSAEYVPSWKYPERSLKVFVKQLLHSETSREDLPKLIPELKEVIERGNYDFEQIKIVLSWLSSNGDDDDDDDERYLHDCIVDFIIAMSRAGNGYESLLKSIARDKSLVVSHKRMLFMIHELQQVSNGFVDDLVDLRFDNEGEFYRSSRLLNLGTLSHKLYLSGDAEHSQHLFENLKRLLEGTDDVSEINVLLHALANCLQVTDLSYMLPYAKSGDHFDTVVQIVRARSVQLKEVDNKNNVQLMDEIVQNIPSEWKQSYLASQLMDRQEYGDLLDDDDDWWNYNYTKGPTVYRLGNEQVGASASASVSVGGRVSKYAYIEAYANAQANVEVHAFGYNKDLVDVGLQFDIYSANNQIYFTFFNYHKTIPLPCTRCLFTCKGPNGTIAEGVKHLISFDRTFMITVVPINIGVSLAASYSIEYKFQTCLMNNPPQMIAQFGVTSSVNLDAHGGINLIAVKGGVFADATIFKGSLLPSVSVDLKDGICANLDFDIEALHCEIGAWYQTRGCGPWYHFGTDWCGRHDYPFLSWDGSKYNFPFHYCNPIRPGLSTRSHTHVPSHHMTDIGDHSEDAKGLMVKRKVGHIYDDCGNKEDSYTVTFNTQTKTPDIVTHYIYPKQASACLNTKSPKRPKFRKDPDIDKAEQPSTDDYTRSGYSRGHMATAQMFNFNVEAYGETFYITNVAPQKQKANQNWYNYCEKKILQYSQRENKDLYVETYTYGNLGNFKGITVPSHFIKVVCAYKDPIYTTCYYQKNDDLGSVVETTIKDCEGLFHLNFFSVAPRCLKSAANDIPLDLDPFQKDDTFQEKKKPFESSLKDEL